MKGFDDAVVKKIDVGFAKSDVRMPLNMQKSVGAHFEKAEKEGGSLVAGMKIPKGNKYNPMLLVQLMAEKILLQESMKIYEADIDKSEKLFEKLSEVQEAIDVQVMMSDGKGLFTEESGIPSFGFASAFEARLKSIAVDKCEELIKAHGVADAKKGKPGVIVKEIDKFKKTVPNKIKIKEDKDKNKEFGAFKEKEDKNAEKKIKEYKGKKGVAVATVSSKKASCPDTMSATKKITGAKVPGSAPKLIIDNKYADKYIKENKEVKSAESLGSKKISGSVPVKGKDSKASGAKGLAAEAKAHPIKKSDEDEVNAFNKSVEESYRNLNRPVLAPKAAPKSK